MTAIIQSHRVSDDPAATATDKGATPTVTVSEVAERTRKSKASVQRWVRRGWLTPV